MLKLLRNKKVQKRIFLGLAVVIIPPFMLWGVKFGDKDDPENSGLASLDGKRISAEDYRASYAAVQRQAQLLYGARANELAGLFNFKSDAFDRILLVNYAKKQRLKVSDNEVIGWITSLPAFAGRGEFDGRLYKLYMDHLRVAPRSFEEEVRQTLLIDKIQEIFRKKISVTDDELKNRYVQENGERDIEYAFLSAKAAEDAKKNPVITEEEVKDVYTKLKSQLVSRDQATFHYLVVPKDAAASLNEIYNEKDLLLDELGKKYNLLVQTYDYPSKTKMIETQRSLPREITSKAFSATLNEESDWLHLDDGSYKFKVVERKAGGPIPFEEAKTMIVEMLKKQKASEVAAKKLEELTKNLTSVNFKETINTAGIEVTSFEKYKKGTKLPGLEDSRIIEQKIEALKTGEVSEAFAVPGGAALLKIVKDAPLDEVKFKAEKETFKKRVLDRKTTEAMNDLLDNLRKKLKVNLKAMNQLFPPESETD